MQFAGHRTTGDRPFFCFFFFFCLLTETVCLFVCLFVALRCSDRSSLCTATDRSTSQTRPSVLLNWDMAARRLAALATTPLFSIQKYYVAYSTESNATARETLLAEAYPASRKRKRERHRERERESEIEKVCYLSNLESQSLTQPDTQNSQIWLVQLSDNLHLLAPVGLSGSRPLLLGLRRYCRRQAPHFGWRWRVVDCRSGTPRNRPAHSSRWIELGTWPIANLVKEGSIFIIFFLFLFFL